MRTFKELLGSGKKLIERQRKLNEPEEYHLDDDLRSAVGISLILGLPLLVTGRPGTGKTQLAKRVAFELELDKELFPLTFHTKSTSSARDLFYHYDALGHFRDSQTEANSYITYNALGLAIILTLAPAEEQRAKINDRLPKDLRKKGPVRPVVLIDEIDKAPRDFPNDLLNEIEAMSFTVNEVKDDGGKKQGLLVTADIENRPIVIITSNSERDLPDAFLRRCVFFHIEPPTEVLLNKIVTSRLDLDDGFSPAMRDSAIKHFLKIRELQLEKTPATAELLAWIRVLEMNKIDVRDPSKAEEIKRTYVTLAKSDKDLLSVREAFDKGLMNLG